MSIIFFFLFYPRQFFLNLDKVSIEDFFFKYRTIIIYKLNFISASFYFFKKIYQKYTFICIKINNQI